MNGLPYVDLHNGIIELSGEVDVNMWRKTYRGMMQLSDRDMITILLNTEGGDFYQGLAIHDLIRFSDIPVKVVCNGPVMSAGVLILAAGEERVALPKSQIMIHYGEDTSTSSTSARHNAEMLKLMKDIIGTKSKVKRATINGWFKKDTYFNSKQALKAGLVDRIAKYGKVG